MAGKEIDKAAADLAMAAAGPAAKTFGESAAEVGKVAGDLLLDVAQTTSSIVKLGLLPAKALIWGWETVEKKVLPRIVSKLDAIPEENKVMPSASLVASVLDSSKFVADNDELANMFANLVASAADSRLSKDAHPAFAEIIRQLSPIEASLLMFFGTTQTFRLPIVEVRFTKESDGQWQSIQRHLTNLKDDDAHIDRALMCRAVENFERLGLINTDYMITIAAESFYEPFDRHPFVIDTRPKALIPIPIGRDSRGGFPDTVAM